MEQFDVPVKILEAGSTKDQVSLGRTEEGVLVLCLEGSSVNSENRWTLEFCLAIHKAFDSIEQILANDEEGTPAALLTISKSPKFFSNGIDPAALLNPPPGFDLELWNALVMPAFVRPILLPIPTICCVNGHAFGAGFMFAVGHDYRIQNAERGYICAIEIAIGIETPPPELTLFRHSMPVDAFLESMMFAKRWSGPEAKQAGVVHQAVPKDELFEVSMKKAIELSALGKNRHLMERYKLQLKGYVADEVMNYVFPNGKVGTDKPLPKGLQAHVEKVVNRGSLKETWGVEHNGLGRMGKL